MPELGQDLRGVDGPAARQALHDRTIGMLRERRRDGRGELLDVRHERGEDGDERADDFAARLGLGISYLAGGGPAEAGEQLGDRTPATVGVLAEELREALFAEARGTLRRGVPGEKGEGDRRVDVGEDRAGARPEPLEERAELVGERDPLSDEVVTAAHEGAQRAGVVRRRSQWPEGYVTLDTIQIEFA